MHGQVVIVVILVPSYIGSTTALNESQLLLLVEDLKVFSLVHMIDGK
jgi:hypothetical protein